MKTRIGKFGTGILAVTLALGSSLAVSTAARADTVDAVDDQVTMPLTFNGFNAERAATYGYDVRTDDEGWQYAVPTGTPAASTEGATPKYNPETGEMKTADGARNTVPGSCGTSTLTLYTKTSGYTAYNLNGSVGGAISHQWGINLSASTGSQYVNRNGLPPFPGALNWGTNFSYNVGASATGATVNGVAGGIVQTVFGSCTSGGPRDSV